jgi:lysophospholipase L1-like esterase
VANGILRRITYYLLFYRILMNISYFLRIALLLVCHLAYAQEDIPFEKEIQAFEAQDKQKFPPRNAIVFTGSSSIRLWKDLDASFPGKKVIGRGFGGSNLNDLDRYLDRIVFPYKPRKVVIYSGENDIAQGVPAEEVVSRFQRVFTRLRQQLPRASVIFISMKPSPSRAEKIGEMQKANIAIELFLNSQPNTAYVDVFTLMLDEAGNPRTDLFVEDNLHMNEEGYTMWASAIAPYLK